MLGGKAAVGPGKGENDQIDAHNTITLTSVSHEKTTLRQLSTSLGHTKAPCERGNETAGKRIRTQEFKL